MVSHFNRGTASSRRPAQDSRAIARTAQCYFRRGTGRIWRSTRYVEFPGHGQSLTATATNVQAGQRHCESFCQPSRAGAIPAGRRPVSCPLLGLESTRSRRRDASPRLLLESGDYSVRTKWATAHSESTLFLHLPSIRLGCFHLEPGKDCQSL